VADLGFVVCGGGGGGKEIFKREVKFSHLKKLIKLKKFRPGAAIF